jgi:hypothetical protein
MPGHYETRRVGYQWVDGRWTKKNKGWVWVEGHWQPVAQK